MGLNIFRDTSYALLSVRAKFGQDSEVLEVPEISVEDCKILVESCDSFEHFKKQVEVIL